MNEKQQTAVQWLIEQIMADKTSAWKDEIVQALNMERDQKLLAHIAGQEHKTPFIYDYDAAERYFTDTYQTEP